mmetsp:Transcript_82161/g.227902  ORF Transcript_82161/g.227902 Transcript_82161/m.227902 type:complete len:255 (-) Transcript_82161:168-932(-)
MREHAQHDIAVQAGHVEGPEAQWPDWDDQRAEAVRRHNQLWAKGQCRIQKLLKRDFLWLLRAANRVLEARERLFRRRASLSDGMGNAVEVQRLGEHHECEGCGAHEKRDHQKGDREVQVQLWQLPRERRHAGVERQLAKLQQPFWGAAGIRLLRPTGCNVLRCLAWQWAFHGSWRALRCGFGRLHETRAATSQRRQQAAAAGGRASSTTSAPAGGEPRRICICQRRLPAAAISHGGRNEDKGQQWAPRPLVKLL